MTTTISLNDCQYERLVTLITRGRTLTRDAYQALAEPALRQLIEAKRDAERRAEDRPGITCDDALEAVIMVCEDLPSRQTTQAIITEGAAELLDVHKDDAAAPVSKAIAMLMHSGEVVRSTERFGRTFRIEVRRFLTPAQREAAIRAAEVMDRVA